MTQSLRIIGAILLGISIGFALIEKGIFSVDGNTGFIFAFFVVGSGLGLIANLVENRRHSGHQEGVVE